MSRKSSGVQRNSLLVAVREYSDKEFNLMDVAADMNPRRRMTQQQMAATLRMAGYRPVSVNVWKRMV